MSTLPVDDKADIDTHIRPVYALAAEPGFVSGIRGRAFAACANGLYRCKDGGITWENALEELMAKERIPFTSLVISPNYQRDPFLAAGTTGGVFCSMDYGKTWSASAFPPPFSTVNALAISPNFNRDNTIFAGTGEDGIFISQSRGKSWAAWNFGLLDFNILCLAISPDFTQDETLFAGTESGIFRSNNSGKSWQEVELPFGYEPVLSLAFICLSENNRSLLAGTENQGLWISGDAGRSWARLAPNIIKEPVNAILVSENDTHTKILIVSGESVWLSLDPLMVWERLLPESFTGRTISAVIAPQGLDSGASLLCGFMDGEIAVVRMYTQAMPGE